MVLYRMGNRWAGKAMQDKRPDYSGMTTNERLFVAGVLDQFDDAARKRDRATMIELLSRVELGEQAALIADTILANPTRYGF